MLKKLGYDPDANPPNYGKPDTFVMENMNELDRNKKDWENKENILKNMREEIRKNIFNSSKKIKSE